MKDARKQNVITAARRVREGRKILQAATQHRHETAAAYEHALTLQRRAQECLEQAEHCLSEAVNALPA